MKKLNNLGYEAYGIDVREFHARESRFSRTAHRVVNFTGEIILILGIIAIAYSVGLLIQNSGQAAESFGGYLTETQAQQESEYQTSKVLNALAMQRRAEETVHEVTGAEMPPYWTAPAATK